MISRNARAEIRNLIGRFWTPIVGNPRYRAEKEQKEFDSLAQAYKHPDLETQIERIQLFANQEPEKIRKEKINVFVQALKNLNKVINDDIELQVRRQLLLKSEENIRSSVAYQVANETSTLLNDLKFNVESQQNDFNQIMDYTNRCKKILPPYSPIKNFGKSIITVAITATDVIIGTTVGILAGAIASPALAAYGGWSLGAVDPVTNTGKVIGAACGSLLGLSLSPILFVGAVCAGAFGGGYGGIKTGKDWTGTHLESLSKFLLFRPSRISSTANNVTKSAKNLFAPQKSSFSNANDAKSNEKEKLMDISSIPASFVTR